MIGIDNLESIASVDGVDAIYIGVYDLAQSLGHPGKPYHPDVTNKMDECIKLCHKHDVKIGTLVESLEQAQKFYDKGFDYLCYKADCAILSDATKGLIEW